MNPEQLFFNVPDGGYLSALRWSCTSGDSDAPLLLFSHATGFHAATYSPLFNQLIHHMNIVAVDSRGHGQSTAPAKPEQLKAWTQYYSDLAAVVDALKQPVILAGHSIGGMCSLAVAARKPEQVEGVIALDPVMLDPTQGIPMRILQWLERSNRFPLAAVALRRKAEFASIEEAHANYKSKRSFSRWPEEWLKAYTDGAFLPTEQGVRLRCEPAWESRTFARVEHWPWRHVNRIQAPVLLMTAEHESTCSAKSRKRLANLPGAWDLRTIRDGTHFFPMEKTGEVAHAMIDFVKKRKIG